MLTTVSPDGTIPLPEALRRQDGVAAGQHFEVERLDAGQYTLRRREPALADEAGSVVDWLRACPEADWFQAVPSESTRSL